MLIYFVIKLTNCMQPSTKTMNSKHINLAKIDLTSGWHVSSAQINLTGWCHINSVHLYYFLRVKWQQLYASVDVLCAVEFCSK